MKVLMMPVCAKCGHVFDALSVKNDNEPHMLGENIRLVDYCFEPNFCPDCHSYIEGVVYQAPVDNLLDFDASRFKDMAFRLERAGSMTSEEFRNKMLEIKKIWYDAPKYNDRETRIKMLGLVYEVLYDSGYSEGAKIFKDCLYYLFGA